MFVDRNKLDKDLNETVVYLILSKSDGTFYAVKCTLSKDIIKSVPTVDETVTDMYGVRTVYDIHNKMWFTFGLSKVLFFRRME